MAAPSTPAPVDPRVKVLEDYRKKVVDHSNLEAKLKDGPLCRFFSFFGSAAET